MSQKENNLVDYLTGYKSTINFITDKQSKWDSLSTDISALTKPITQQYLEYINKDLDNNLSVFSSITSLLPNIDYLKSSSPILDISRQATLAVTQLSSSTSFINQLSKINEKKESLDLLFGSHISFQKYESEKIISLIGTDLSSKLSFQNQIYKATELSIYAEKSILNLTTENIGNKLNINSIDKNNLLNNFLDFSKSYKTLFSSFDTNPKLFSEINPILTRIIPSEYYSTADALEIVSVNEDITEEEITIKNEIIYENEVLLSNHLPKLHSGLYNMWKGAIESFKSENPEKIRHFITSIRELYTHVFQILAPDNDIKTWSTDASLYHNNHPTRKARLLYICRNVNSDDFKSFVQKDVVSTLAFIDIFQKGTHKIESNFNNQELNMIKSKAESTLKFLLEIHFVNNL